MNRILSWFEGLVDPYPGEPPSQAPNTLFQFCRYFTRSIEPLLILMAILTALIAISEALLYAVLGQLVDWLALRDPQHFLEQEWPILLAFSAFILIVIPLLVVANTLLMHQTLMGNFPMIVRWQAHRYLLDQSYSFFQQEFSGRIATKLMQTALAVRDTVMTVLDVMVFVIVYFVTTLILVINADWRLCLPILGWLLMYMLCLKYFLPRLESISSRQADARADMTGRIVDSYSNILTLKLFSHSERESGYARKAMHKFMGTVHPQMRLVSGLDICVWTINMLLVFSTAAFGLYLWATAAVTPGAIAIAMAIAIRLTGMSHWIMWEVSQLFENIGTMHDGMNTLSIRQQVIDAPDANELQVSRGKIEFRDVYFGYQAGTENSAVFEQFELEIAAGEKIGLVGRSGAGKSTLVNVLLRFYDIESGKICIDGQNIAQVTQKSLRENIATVSQDTSLLHRTVRENIMFGRPDATDEELFAAAEKAQAHDFILNLRDAEGRTGYDAHVGERGVTLSGGQRQRIAIARILLKDAPILILDEATSALDSEIESAIQQCLYELMAGKTVIAIAHRLSTIAAMDRLIVLDEGKIIEQGSHQQLLDKGGLYHNLWAHQSGGFLGH